VRNTVPGLLLAADDLADRVDVPCTRWPPKRVSARIARSRLTARPDLEVAERGGPQRLGHQVGGEPLARAGS
jgi:hypothetical protein